MNSDPRLLLILDLLLKSAVVLSLALLAARLWRGASAANRHLIWLAAFAVLLLAPLTALIPPRWSWQPMETQAPAPTAAPVALPDAPAQAPANATLPATTAVTTAAASAAPPAPGWPAWLAPRNALPLVWLAGVLARLARLAAGLAQLWRWRRRSAPIADARAQALGRQIAADLRLKRVLELRTLASCRVPMTWGALRPVVLLPAEAADWPETRLALVLRHELGHVARRDWLARLLTQTTTALYWPNPLVWLAARAARLAQEQACDDLVLAAGVPAQDYALELVAAARRLHGRYPAGPAVAMAEPSTLGKRVDGIVAAGRDRRPAAGRTFALVLAVVALASAIFALVQLRTKVALSQALRNEIYQEIWNNEDLAAKKATLSDPAVDMSAQVVIEAVFIKVRQDAFEFKELAQYGTAAGTSETQWIGRLDVPDALRALAQKPGFEVMGKSAMTVASAGAASLSIGQEIRYPQDYTDAGEPKDFQTRKIGFELRASPIAKKDRTINLDLNPNCTWFEGFVRYGEKKNLQPVFSTWELTTRLTVPDGATLVMGGMALAEKKPAAETLTREGVEKMFKASPDSTDKRIGLIFITARILKADNPAGGGAR
jgi:beta-lactamase regulating signal transducer with metallopeptidase domain